MSHIDSYPHEIVGMFGRLPVYHPLEDIEGEDDEHFTGDFSCTTGQIVIGGGSGEHEGLILRKPAAAVGQFLWMLIGDDRIDGGRDEWKELIDFSFYEREIIEFSGWSTKTHAKFYELCTTALPHPYDDDSFELGFEAWLIAGLGEFVFYAMPELASELMDKLDDPYRGIHHVEYNNITLIPPNMPVYANGGNAFTMTRRNAPKA
ncbi:hypothetical protein FF098_001920 [Parvularcula flava]|uniref:Uncharacterized protein n=1 Tax=Aquisalinus luteolus TaxID=1566827 RepID=A0A8J3A0J6_9PROT|nr:hypothetical protein [Aquisalinus luteolus]NHK26663.1 hypothetical protein [Aquisalinus luteolus]GGH93027.1 hypothetical protein GCM10011355_03900 [Aquisalinus luteolus]